MNTVNNFYIGASHIAQSIKRGVKNSHCHETLEQAIADATNKIQHGTDDFIIIVQVVKVVCRTPPPVEVIDVRPYDVSNPE